MVAGWPGSVHDARILRNCDIWNLGPQWCGQNTHLIGDGAYPLKIWLLKPYQDNGHLTCTQRCFNYRLSSARVAIEQAFGLLKGRFRRLKLLDTKSIKTAVDTIICCVFHNICLINDDVLEEYIEDNREEQEDDPAAAEIYGQNDEDQDEGAIAKQNRIANMFV